MGWSRRVVHDLRNPLSPLRTAAYLLRHGRVDADEQRQLLEVVDRQSARLLAMLDELADGFSASRDDMAARHDLLDLRSLVEDSNASAAVFDGDGLLPVRGDPARLGQLLRTLRTLRLHPGHDDAAVPLRAWIDHDVVHLERRLHAEPALRDAPAALLDAPLPASLSDGLGLSLPIAAAIARAHGGMLRIEPDSDDAARLVVRVELPRAAL